MTGWLHLGTTSPDGEVVPWCDPEGITGDVVLPPDPAPFVRVTGRTCPRCARVKAATLGLPTRRTSQHLARATAAGAVTSWCGRPIEDDGELRPTTTDEPFTRHNPCPYCSSARAFVLDLR